MLIVSGRGQGLGLDGPERHLAGECWRDDGAVNIVSARCPLCLCGCGLIFSAAACVRGGWEM